MFARAQSEKGRSGRQDESGASWSELFLAESMCQIAWDSLRAMSTWATFAPPLLAEPALGSLVGSA